MYAIVLGAGEVGFHLTRILAQEGHDVTIVDRQQAGLDRVAESLDVRTVRGNAVATEILDQIDAHEADMALAVTDSDEVNLLAAAAARQFGARATVARVGNRISGASQLVYRDILGIDLILSAEMLAAIEISKLILTPGAVDVESFAQGKVQLRQLRVEPDSEVAGQALRDVDLPAPSLIASLVRGDGVVIPGGKDILHEGTDAIIIGGAMAFDEIERRFGHETREAKRVVLVGGGELGYTTALRLEGQGLDVRLLERDPQRAEWLAEHLEHTVVLLGDGTDISVLTEQRLGGVDAFVATSGDDELNLMAGLLAKELGARTTISLVDRGDYTSLYKRLGINHTISPRLLMADHIIRFLRRGDVVSTAFVLGEQAEALEVVAGEDSRLVGKPLRKLKLPRGALIGAVVRREEVIVPRGDDTIEPGDTVVVFTLASVRPQIEKWL